MAEYQQSVRGTELKSTGLDLPKMQLRSGPNSIGYCEEYISSSPIMLTRTGTSLAEYQQSVRSTELKSTGLDWPKMPQRSGPNSIGLCEEKSKERCYVEKVEKGPSSRQRFATISYRHSLSFYT